MALLGKASKDEGELVNNNSDTVRTGANVPNADS